jgi:hypothetical protein
MLALHGPVFGVNFDLVVSGINRGDNCGLHITYRCVDLHDPAKPAPSFPAGRLAAPCRAVSRAIPAAAAMPSHPTVANTLPQRHRRRGARGGLQGARQGGCAGARMPLPVPRPPSRRCC